MSYQLCFHETAGYLHVRVTGANTPEVVRSYLQDVGETCASRRCAAVLIEENLAGPGLKLGEIFNIVNAGSERRVAHELKIAFVDTNTQHAAQSMAFAQTAARNRGIDMRVFATVQEAQVWLRGKKP